MAGQLQEIAMQDFSGGENLVVSPYLIGPKQSARVENMILDEHGSLRTRDGTLAVTTAPTTDAIVTLYDYVQVTSSIIKLALVRLGGGNKLYNRATVPWTLIGTFTSGEPTPEIQTFTDLAIIANGYEVPRSYNGTALTALVGGTGTVPAGAKHLAVHLGFLWAWNTNGTTTSLDGPSSLRSSALNDPNTWPNANQVFVSKDDGQAGTGLGLFTIAETGISPTATMVAFKNFSAYQVSGVFGSSAFAVQKIKSDMGCVAPRSIQFLSGFGVMRLTHRGFAIYDGVNDLLVSEEERPKLFGGGDVTSLDWTYIDRSWATQIANPPLYLCACPTSGPPLTRVFIYDLVRRAWTTATFANPMATLHLMTDPGTLPQALAGDYNGGKVRRLFSLDQNDDGTAISWKMRTRTIAAQSPVERNYFRRVVVKLYNAPALSSVTGKLILGPATSAAGATIPLSQQLAPFNGFGLDAYGVTPYGSNGSPVLTDVDVTFDIGRIANNAALELSGTGPITIREVAWHVRKKTLTRPTTAA